VLLQFLMYVSHPQAFELQGVVARATLLQLLQSRNGLVPLSSDDSQVKASAFHKPADSTW
jgi:hypothetical protein